MAGRSDQIEFLPDGWVWVYKGQEQWLAGSKISTERHAHNLLTGKDMSVRQAQAMQRAERARLGQPKPAPIQRQGRTKRILGGGMPGDNTKHGEVGSIYNPNRHGQTESWVFRSFDDARNYITLNGAPEWAQFAIIQIRYSKRLVTTNKVGSDKQDSNGYASISSFTSTQDLVAFTNPAFAPRGDIASPWDVAESNLNNYDMNGSRARVYILFMEK